jgi:hypothetical protein
MSRGRSRRQAEASLLRNLEDALGRTPHAASMALPWRWRYELVLGIGAYLSAIVISRATTDAGRSLTWHLGVLLATGPTRRGDRCRPTAGPAPAAG